MDLPLLEMHTGFNRNLLSCFIEGEEEHPILAGLEAVRKRSEREAVSPGTRSAQLAEARGGLLQRFAENHGTLIGFLDEFVREAERARLNQLRCASPCSSGPSSPRPRLDSNGSSSANIDCASPFSSGPSSPRSAR